jgi:hypothetical protein
MARRVSIPEQTYPVGSTSITLDNFNPNTKRIEVSLTRVGWPGVPADTVAQLKILWSDGSGANYDLPGGVVNTPGGQPLLVQLLSIGVPQEAGPSGKQSRAVNSGTVTFTVIQSLTTAITGEAFN